MKKYMDSFITGVGAFISLNLFYSLVMRILGGSWWAVVSQFEKLWYFMVPLTIGFGMQVGLYHHLRKMVKNNSHKNVVVANTAASAIGMVACCAHHLTDVLPLIGLTALSTFLISYQAPILIVGIISNILGIYFLLRKITLGFVTI